MSTLKAVVYGIGIGVVLLCLAMAIRACVIGDGVNGFAWGFIMLLVAAMMTAPGDMGNKK